MSQTDLLEHKGYYGSVHLDPDENILFGKVKGIRSLINYEGTDPTSLKGAFVEAVESYLESCAEKKITPEKPFKGSFNIRPGEARHRKAYLAALAHKQTLNEYICCALDAYERVESHQ